MPRRPRHRPALLSSFADWSRTETRKWRLGGPATLSTLKLHTPAHWQPATGSGPGPGQQFPGRLSRAP
eukprot:741079-Rhodomonas_salina.1